MNRYLNAVSTNFIFFSINIIFFLVVTPLSIKVMGEEFYGLWVVLSALMLLTNIGNLGIDAIVMKFSAEIPTQGNPELQFNRIMTTGYFIVFITSILTAALLLLARNPIVNNIHTSMELGKQFHQAILWIAASIFPQFLTRVPHGYLLSQLRNRSARQIELFSSIFSWTGAVVIASIQKNLVSIAAWCFFSNLLVFGLYFQSSQRLLPFRIRPDKSTTAKMFNFSGYMFIESLAITFFQQFDKVIVSFTLGPVFAGAYSVGTSLALRISMITGQATEVMIPYASLQESLDGHQKLYEVFRQLSRYMSLLLAGMGSLLIIWMNVILSRWISPDYAAHYASGFRILVVAYSLLSLCRPAHQTLTGIGKVKLTSLVYLFSTILMLVCVYFLSGMFGFLGAAASNLVLTILLVFNLSVYTKFGIPVQWRLLLADLKWGLVLPIFTFGLSLFLSESNIVYKLLESIILGILFTLIIIRDKSAKVEMLRVLDSVFAVRT